MMLFVLPALLAFVCAWWLTKNLCSPKSFLSILAHPNERTLHAMPTPQTGGLAVVGSVVISLVLAASILAITQPAKPVLPKGMASGSVWIVTPGEKRIAATPQTILKLEKLGFDVHVESNAGDGINCSDSEFLETGAVIVNTAKELWATSDLVLKVRPPEQNTELGVHEADLMKEGGSLIGFMWPAQNRELLDKLAARKATVFGMDSVPRITRAQKMDTLSAMANIAGYRAIVEAANHFPRVFTGQITAAGKIDPAKVLGIGAGVAGLSAIGAAKGLGAIVRAFDPRSAKKDQVASMGAEFLDLDVKEEGESKGGYAKEMSDAFLKAEMALFAQQAMQVDIIVTTALIPGKTAPTSFELITVAGFLAFARTPADLCLLETGMGGRLDATNIVTAPLASVITVISYDHTQFLGSTLAAIAGEKAGIMKQGSPCIIGPQTSDGIREGVMEVFAEKAEEMKAPLYRHGHEWSYEPTAQGFILHTGTDTYDFPALICSGLTRSAMPQPQP